MRAPEGAGPHAALLSPQFLMDHRTSNTIDLSNRSLLRSAIANLPGISDVENQQRSSTVNVSNQKPVSNPEPVDVSDQEHAWDLKDGLGQVRLRNVDGVRCVIDEDGSVFTGEGDELLQLLARGGRPCRVVGVAEEDQVCGLHLHISGGRSRWQDFIIREACKVQRIRLCVNCMLYVGRA